MSNDFIQIKVKLFAAYQEAYGISELLLEFPRNTPVSQVLDKIIAEKKELEQWQSVTRFAVNLQFVDANTIIHNGDEVVLIPPVSGG